MVTSSSGMSWGGSWPSCPQLPVESSQKKRGPLWETTAPTDSSLGLTWSPKHRHPQVESGGNHAIFFGTDMAVSTKWYPNSWMVYYFMENPSINDYKWMIWGYHHFRKPPFLNRSGKRFYHFPGSAGSHNRMLSTACWCFRGSSTTCTAPPDREWGPSNGGVAPEIRMRLMRQAGWTARKPAGTSREHV